METRAYLPSMLEKAFSLRASGDPSGASKEFHRVSAVFPSDSTAWTMLGIQSSSLSSSDPMAGKFFERAVISDRSSTSAMLNLATWTRDSRQDSDAVSWLERLLCLDPAEIRAIFLKGIIRHERGRYREAMTNYLRILNIEPHHPEAHTNLGFIELANGIFDAGWKHYEWRTKTALHTRLHPADPRYPRWDGGNINGLTILLTSEQGLGDTIQFARYASDVAAKGARVILQVHPSLVQILSRIKGVADAISHDPTMPVDVQAPLMSLPSIFSTRLDSIPYSSIPYLQADSNLSAIWRDRLGPKNGARIGAVWSGSTPQRVVERSIPLAEFIRIFSSVTNSVELICLQKEIWPRDSAALKASPNIRFFGEQIRDFADTAALINQCDFVITIDTSVAHLSGALGTETWLLLPAVADWRWFIDEDRSPWYSNMRIYRQSQLGDWSTLISRIRNDLDLRLIQP